jgi:hypothetical protein
MMGTSHEEANLFVHTRNVTGKKRKEKKRKTHTHFTLPTTLTIMFFDVRWFKHDREKL